MTDNVSDVVAYRTARARETLDEAQVMADSMHWNACVNRLYYACFYAVTALLASREIEASRHSMVRSFFNRDFVKTGIFPRELATVYNDLFETRRESDYEDFFSSDPSTVQSWIPLAAAFVEAAAAQLVGPPGPAEP